MAFRILIIDDEKEFASSLAEYLGSFGYETATLTSSEKWEVTLGGTEYDLVLLDIRMPGVGGFDILRGLGALNPNTPVIMISGFASVENIVRAMRFGAVNFYEKPIDLRELVNEINKLLDTRNRRPQPGGQGRIITENPRMLEVIRMIEKSADTPAPVLITGESGTGKEMIANSLHSLSSRRARPLIKINCAAIPDALLESELFGYEAGAFTDAKHRKLGKFEVANGGTMFFDELSEMSMNVQAKLLRVIQDGRFERLGGSDSIFADARIISATNRNIRDAISGGTFREDLFYRLAVITIEVPPLRERKEDVLPLAEHFLRHYADSYQRPVRRIDENVKNIFLSLDWLGNVRELKNVIERAVIFCEGDTLTAESLPSQYRATEALPLHDLNQVYNSLSREMILEALRKADGKKQIAAKILNVHRKTLYNRMKRLGIRG
ncbi:MAG: sigma-54-dependent transcriptional regulator [Spirochaetaceae bacterium]